MSASSVPKLALEYLLTSSLTPFTGNARTHSKKQIKQVADSIEEFGWTNPIIIDENKLVLAGHCRLDAAKLLRLEEVPTILLSSMSEAQKRAYILADNRLAEVAGWDPELLKAEIQFLVDCDLSFDVELIGFETADIDRILASEVGGQEEALELPELGGAVVSCLGDLWAIGSHRLLCGDAREPAAYERLLGGKKAQMVFTDPPYNVRIAGNVSGLGKVAHREFAMASGEMSSPEFISFLEDTLQRMADCSQPGAIHFVCMDWKHIEELSAAGRKVYSELKNLCVWAKTNAGMGTFYRSQHELVFVFKVGRADHVNNFGLGEKGRHRSNVWTYAGVNTFRKGRAEDLAAHPTVKPLAMVADAILDCSRRNGIVLDAFAGSGTTLLAADRTGRRGFGIELDPQYVDVCIERLEKQTGASAVLEDGRSFAEVKANRLQAREAA